MRELEEFEKKVKETRIEIASLLNERQKNLKEAYTLQLHARELEKHIRKKREYLLALYDQVRKFNKDLARR